MKHLKEVKPIEYYLELNYPITIYRAEEGGYVAEIEDLPGCITEGENLEEATQRIDDARVAWIETAYEDGMEIPLPRTDEEYSGKFVVRLPKYLHRRLAEQARREGVSLNQYVESILSGGASAKSVLESVIVALDKIAKPVAAHRVVFPYPSPDDFSVSWIMRETEQEPLVHMLGKAENKEQVAA